MIPLSYRHQQPPLKAFSRSNSPTRIPSAEQDNNRAQPFKPTMRQQSPADELPQKSQRILSVSAATLSQPVIIPTRTHSSRIRRPYPLSRSPSDEKIEKHDPNAIPPSMAALLAITNISHPQRQKIRSKGFGRRTEIEKFSADEYRHLLSSSSPKSWSILQSPPDTESDVEVDSIDAETDRSSITSRSIMPPFSSMRSLSYDSMHSSDIDFDMDSSCSLSPPNFPSRCKQRVRKEKRPSPAFPLSSDGDHPLSIASYPEADEPTPSPTPIAETSDLEPRFPSLSEFPAYSFKSNLTASIRMLKSAARSLSVSQFQNPAMLSPGVKLLGGIGRSVNSSPGTQKGLGYQQLVGPQKLRLPSNIDALPFYLSSQLPAPQVKSSIQLQPYLTSPLSTPSATAPPIFLPAANPEPLLEEPGPRERQQRENSNFLRVVVLEMNMRRAGKLNGDGRARLWLGARKEKFDDNKDVMSESGQGIADGAKGSGAVFLDGEVGEAQEIDNEEERLERLGMMRYRNGISTRKPLARRDKRVPVRWISITI